MFSGHEYWQRLVELKVSNAISFFSTTTDLSTQSFLFQLVGVSEAKAFSMPTQSVGVLASGQLVGPDVSLCVALL